MKLKNATIVPNPASTASMMAIAARISRSMSVSRSRPPSSALKTYRLGSVTASVSTNNSGTFTAEASICSTALSCPPTSP